MTTGRPSVHDKIPIPSPGKCESLGALEDIISSCLHFYDHLHHNRAIKSTANKTPLEEHFAGFWGALICDSPHWIYLFLCYFSRSQIPAGSGFVLSIKINSAEFQEGGLDQNDVINMAKHFDELGFDFIELTGGNLEAARMGHVKESTKKREAYFIEFAGAIKPNIQNAAIYLTGGFRTAPAMVAAIRNNETDGIGLARPAAAEPDLPKKIINHGVQSCAATIFADDFMISMPAANTQLAQAGSSDVSECHGDLCHGISDFSNPDEAETYKNAMFKWFGELCEAGSKGRAEIGVFEYHTRSKNAPHEHKGFIRRLLESI